MAFNPVRADEGTFKEIEFLWFPFIQKDNLNMLTGDPGAGKSTFICEFAASLSKARPMPGEKDTEAKARGPLNTLILNAEDGFEDTIKWRLRNQDADMTRVWVETTGQTIDAALIKELFNFIRAKDIALLVVDPIQAWIGGDTDMHKANHTRAWTNQFRELPCTTLFCRHMRKSGPDDRSPAMYGGLGSIDLTGAVRSEIRASAPRGQQYRTIERIKGNVGPMMTIKYYIEDTLDPRNKHGKLRWSVEGPTMPAKKTEKAKSDEVRGAKAKEMVTLARALLTKNKDMTRQDFEKLFKETRVGSISTFDRHIKSVAEPYDVVLDTGKTTKYRLKSAEEDIEYADERPSDDEGADFADS